MAEGEVWLVRHGETEWSRDHRHTSTTDLPLTAQGESVARQLRTRLDRRFDRVLTSPRSRARETATLAGHPAAEVDDGVPGWTVWSHPMPGGESADQVTERLDRVVERARAGGSTLVFGHGHALRALTARWLALPVAEGRLFRLDTATVSVLGFEREQPVVLRWNA